MKKASFMLLLVASLTLTAQGQEWNKIDIGTSYDIRKIITFDNELLVFTSNEIIRSSDLINWTSSPMPESGLNLSPIVAFDKVYVNSLDGLYVWDGSAFVLVLNQEVTAMTATNERIFIFTKQSGPSAKFSINGIEFNELNSLNEILPSGYLTEKAEVSFSVSFADTIICAAKLPNALPRRYESYDLGESWKQVNPNVDFMPCKIITTPCRQEIGTNHPGYFFMANGCQNIYEQKGCFTSMTSADNNDIWYTGINISSATPSGLIIRNLDLENAYSVPELLNDISYFKGHLVVVGDNGAVYSKRESSQGNNNILFDEKPVIYPNPATNTIEINGLLPGIYTIYDVYGQKIKDINYNSQEANIVNIEDLPVGLYLLAGIKIVKF